MPYTQMSVLFLLIWLSCMQLQLECVQQRFNPFTRAIHWQLQQPPLRHSANLFHKEGVTELWLEQPLDHFQPIADNRTWLMRYLRNDRYFQPHGPIFIFLGGEWEVSSDYLLTGHMHDIARQHDGIMYYMEHRYYGQSWPTGSAETVYLEHLTASQALADVASFIQLIKSKDDKLSNSKVFLVGASYSGSLVAWFSELYPALMSAGWASSAPFVLKQDFYEYMQQVSVVLSARGGACCQQYVQHGIAAMTRLLHTTNVTLVLQELRIGPNFSPQNMLDRGALFNGIGNYFAAYAQNYDEKLVDVCNQLLTSATNTDDVSVFRQFVQQVFWPSWPDVKQADWCIDLSYEGMQSVFSVDEVQSGSNASMVCNSSEFGWFATTSSQIHTNYSHQQTHNATSLPQINLQPITNSHTKTFGSEVPLAYFQQLCTDVFGADVAQLTNKGKVGTGSNTNITTKIANVIFTYGQLDPWRAVGLQNGRNVINIPDYTHTADLGSINLLDSVEMNVAKLKVAAFLRRALRS